MTAPDSPDFTAPAPDPRRGRRVKATGVLILLTMVWGMTFPVTRLSVTDTDPIQFIALRFGVALPLLYTFLLLRYRGRIHPPGGDADDNAGATMGGLSPIWIRLRNGPLRSVWLRGIVIGLFLFGGYALQVLGLELTTASRSGFFTGMLVVFTPPLALLLRTSRTPKLAWLSLVPAVAGITLIADPETGGMNPGDWFTLGCALVFSLQMIALEALARSDRETRALTLMQVTVIAGLATIWSLLEGNLFEMTRTGWVGIAYTALFGSVIAIWLQTRFQPDVPVAHAGFIFALEPVWASLFAWLLIGEPWTLRGLIGAALMLAAMILSSVAVARGEHQPGETRKTQT